jgi:drug/metabolite transporter (DMT)-like permease
MKIFNYWESWVLIYLISAVVFAQSFKVANRKMKNAGSLTILLEVFTALFSILFIPLFKISFPTDIKIYLTLLVVTIIYAITDRLNIEARYGLEPSTFSMLKQLSTVFLIILGFLFLKEKLLINQLLGALLIISSNILLTYNKGKFKINKYFIMSIISNLLFAVAMLINVNISNNFNIAIYTIITVSIPSFFIYIFGKYDFKALKNEYKRYNKKELYISAFTWCLMLISSVKAYQYGSIIVVAPLLALTSILNAMVEFIFNRDKNKFIQKLIAAILIIIGIILIKI